MNTELPPFKNGEHNSESVSTIDRVLTPLIQNANTALVSSKDPYLSATALRKPAVNMNIITWLVIPSGLIRNDAS